MEHHAPTPDRPVRIPPVVWFLGLGLVSALVALFVFRVPLGTVGYYALIIAFMGSHLFMHGSHGGHGNHASQEQRSEAKANVAASASAPSSQPDEHTGHSGGCH